jgi:hypothetical protein
VEGSVEDFDETFDVSDSPESAGGGRANEGTNVCRVAALSTMFGANRRAVRDLSDELSALGFSEALSSGELDWGDLDWIAMLQRVQRQAEPQQSRVSSWTALQESGQPDAAVSFAVAVLGSELERESAAAAAALWRGVAFIAGPPRRPFDPWLWEFWEDMSEVVGPGWPEFLWWGRPGGEPYDPGGEIEDPDVILWRPDRWANIYNRAMDRVIDRYGKPPVISLLVRWRLAQALRSQDPITRSLASAAFLPTQEEAAEPPEQTSTPTRRGETVSTMIHGTFGWKGDWWRPGAGSFHEFILNNHRPNLYKRGARFSWSGAYRAAHRRIAASDFCDWAHEISGAGVETVFAHSYGGEIAARAKIAGAAIDQVVLLSSPVNGYIDTIAHDPSLQLVDVRLNFDPVLALSQVWQRIARPLPTNVTEVILSSWRTNHAATHKQRVWNAEHVARRGGI